MATPTARHRRVRTDVGRRQPTPDAGNPATPARPQAGDRRHAVAIVEVEHRLGDAGLETRGKCEVGGKKKSNGSSQ